MAVDLEKLEYAADRLEAYVSEELAQTVRLAIAEIRMGDETTAIFMRQVEELRAENARLRKDLADASAAQEQVSAYASDREAHIEELTAEIARLRDAAVCVHDTFAKDIEQGYRTKDKQFAVAVLGQALAATTLDQEN